MAECFQDKSRVGAIELIWQAVMCWCQDFWVTTI